MQLFKLFILRHLATERLRSLTTVLGIALGIGVVIAIQLTNGSSIRGFEAAAASLAGDTSLQIVGSGLGVDERRLSELLWLEELGQLSPVVEGDVRAVFGASPASPASRRERLRVLGVDILRERPFREYATVDAEGDGRQPSRQEFFDLLLGQDSVVLTQQVADAHGLEVGDRMSVMVDDRMETLTVRALLAADGVAAALDGRVAVMDIAAAQLLLGRLGWIDRIDVRLSPDISVDEGALRVAVRLPAGLHVRRPDDQGLRVEKMLESFHVNLTALSYIALVVGLFLVYNTVSIAVIARRPEVGMLRALGVTRRGVVALFLGEALGLALVGCALGLVLGRVMAYGAVELTSTAVSVLYVASAAGDPQLEWWHVGLAFGVGLPLALIAAAVPTAEAALIAPTAVMRGTATVETGSQLHPRHILGPLVLCGLAAWMARQPSVGGLPLWGYGAALAVVFGAAWFVPTVLHGIARGGRFVGRHIFVVEAWLAIASLRGSISRLSISVAALAVSLALTVAIAVMVASFRSTVIYWVEQTLQADLFISPQSRGATRRGRLSDEVERAVRDHPAVLAVDQYRSVDLPYQDRLIVAAAGDFPVLLEHGNLLFKAPDDARQVVQDTRGEDAVVASESFAVRFSVGVGDVVHLDTVGGQTPFHVVAVYYDYSTDRGVLVIDKPTFFRHFGEQRPQSLAVYLRPGADAGRVREDLGATLAERFQVDIRSNAGLRRQVLRIFDSTFAITYALEVVAIVVAILGVIGTLLTLIVDRRREISMLRLIGCGRGQVRRMVILEAAIIGVAAQAIGLVVGLGLSVILIDVINLQSFGWTLQFEVPVGFLLQSTVVVVFTTALAGIYPAHRAATLDTTGPMEDE